MAARRKAKQEPDDRELIVTEADRRVYGEGVGERLRMLAGLIGASSRVLTLVGRTADVRHGYNGIVEGMRKLGDDLKAGVYSLEAVLDK